MQCIGNDWHPDDDVCHCEPGGKPGQQPGFKLDPKARFLVALLALLLVPYSPATESPEALLAAGRVDQAMQILEQQLRTAPTAEAYNLLCRAHFELDNWDAGIPACEKAVALAPDNGLYHLWLGRIYGEKADRSGFLKAAGLAGKVRSEFERAVELSPKSWEARTDLAEFYLEAPGIVGGGKDKARAQAELLVPLNPSMAHWVRGRIAEREKNPPWRRRSSAPPLPPVKVALVPGSTLPASIVTPTASTRWSGPFTAWSRAASIILRRLWMAPACYFAPALTIL